MQQHTSLSALSSDVAVLIFSQLWSFSDVFALATTCRSLRAVWCDNTTSIFQPVARHDIQYLTLARSLLADQGGAPIDCVALSVIDVRRMVRNARKVERSADRFGLEIAVRAPSRNFYYSPPDWGRGHPPYLTSTERPRFIRAYYRVWGLLELNDSEWEHRYRQLTLRQLRRACEIACLPQPFGEEIGPNLKDVLSHWYYPIPRHRRNLNIEMETFFEEEYQRIHGDGLPLPFSTLSRSEYATYVTLFDHSQEQFRESVIASLKPGSTPRDYHEYIREEVWGESSDEEKYKRKWPARGARNRFR